MWIVEVQDVRRISDAREATPSVIVFLFAGAWDRITCWLTDPANAGYLEVEMIGIFSSD